MTAETLVAVLEQTGARLRAEGEKLKLQAPADKVPAPEAIAELRENRAAVLEYLRERAQSQEIQFVSLSDPIPWKTDKLENGSAVRGADAGKKLATQCDSPDCPPESLEAERRFCQAHARLFPFIGKRVWTPVGTGVLLSVFAERCEIHPDGAIRTVRVPAREVRPIQ
jgi:TubC N-terminal docking domain